MKKMFHFILMFFVGYSCFSQQSASLNFLLPRNENKFALYGVGSLNSEGLESLNASGKFSGLFSLHKKEKHKISLAFSVNKNATNSDSTLPSTILFPEVGTTAFLGTLHSMHQLPGKEGSNNVGFFFQAAFKSIQGKRPLVNADRDTTLEFTNMDWSAGITFLKEVYKKEDDMCYFSASTFLSLVNIPTEDEADFNYIIGNTIPLPNFWNLGFKLSIQVNKVQVYSDFRHAFLNANQVSNRYLRGFNYNIGFIFDADIFTR